jgi:hypothetical protein
MRRAARWCTSYADYPPGTPLNLTHTQGTLLPYEVLEGDLAEGSYRGRGGLIEVLNRRCSIGPRIPLYSYRLSEALRGP